jgi:putative salt-induced outer membrane protein
MRETRGWWRAAEAAIVLATILAMVARPSCATPQAPPGPPTPSSSQSSAAEPAPPLKPPPTWDLKLGLSYLATMGNAETSSAGIDASYRRAWGVWSLDATAASVRATRDDKETAENASSQLRGRRKIADGLEATAGLRGETNRFAGVDLRTIADTSLSWNALTTPAWRMRTLWGVSWTREEASGDRPVSSSVGGLLQLQNTVKISEGSELNGQVTAYPDMKDTEDYRINANLALQAALNRHLALRLGYDIRYDNEPIRGFERTDSTSTASLVVQLGRGAGR